MRIWKGRFINGLLRDIKVKFQDPRFWLGAIFTILTIAIIRYLLILAPFNIGVFLGCLGLSSVGFLAKQLFYCIFDNIWLPMGGPYNLWMNNPNVGGGGTGDVTGGRAGYGSLSERQVSVFLNQFKAAIHLAILQKGQGPASITYQEILAQGKTYSTGPRVLEILLAHKCNQPNLGIGSTAITIGHDGSVSYSATLQLLIQ